jgi:hypothetical protein
MRQYDDAERLPVRDLSEAENLRHQPVPQVLHDYSEYKAQKHCGYQPHDYRADYLCPFRHFDFPGFFVSVHD